MSQSDSKTFIMLQKNAISYKCCSLEPLFIKESLKMSNVPQKYSEAQLFSTLIIIRAPNQHIRMNSEESCALPS